MTKTMGGLDSEKVYFALAEGDLVLTWASVVPVVCNTDSESSMAI